MGAYNTKFNTKIDKDFTFFLLKNNWIFSESRTKIIPDIFLEKNGSKINIYAGCVFSDNLIKIPPQIIRSTSFKTLLYMLENGKD